MNERIKELAEEYAFDKLNKIQGPVEMSISRRVFEQSFREKFAELIVKECVICAEREWIRNGDTEHNRAVTKVIESIKEHFGVDQ